MNADLYVSLCMCFTGLNHELACNYLHLHLLCVCVHARVCLHVCVHACVCVRVCLLAAACGQSVVAAVGGTAGQADNRV